MTPTSIFAPYRSVWLCIPFFWWDSQELLWCAVQNHFLLNFVRTFNYNFHDEFHSERLCNKIEATGWSDAGDCLIFHLTSYFASRLISLPNERYYLVMSESVVLVVAVPMSVPMSTPIFSLLPQLHTELSLSGHIITTVRLPMAMLRYLTFRSIDECAACRRTIYKSIVRSPSEYKWITLYSTASFATSYVATIRWIFHYVSTWLYAALNGKSYISGDLIRFVQIVSFDFSTKWCWHFLLVPALSLLNWAYLFHCDKFIENLTTGKHITKEVHSHFCASQSKQQPDEWSVGIW